MTKIIKLNINSIYPYCKYDLQRKLSRKIKCPNCAKNIFVRKGISVTDREAKIQDWLYRVGHFGITRKNFEERENELIKKLNFAPVNDVIWGLFNSLVSLDRQNNSMIYWEMSRLVQMEGKDPSHYLKQSYKGKLLGYIEEGFKFVETGSYINDDLVCEKCKNLNGKIYQIKDALVELPIPNECNSQHGCRCDYHPKFDI